VRSEDKYQAGLAHFRAGRLALAETNLRAAAAAKPRSAPIQHDLGMVLRARGRFTQAANAFIAAIAAEPDMASAHLGLAGVRQRLDGDEAAEPHARRAVALAPLSTPARVFLGDVLRGLGRLDDSRGAYGAALRVSPNDGDARFGRAFLNLLQGDFAAGWPDYEFRRSRRDPPPSPLARQWRGQNPADKTLLLYAEQGLGDSIQFLRYAAPLADLGAKVLAAVPISLMDLARRAPGVHEVVQPSLVLPPFDICCPLPSVPLMMNARLDAIPAPTAYLTPPAERVAAWRGRLGSSPKLTVAIAWAGNRNHPNDYNRSADIGALGPLFQVPGVRWINMQTGVDAAELRARRGGPEIIAVGEALRDLTETAAVLASADLVISVDTALCHLGGAMARPTWILLPYAPDWRWLCERHDSPWYGSARLYRQSKPRDWIGLVKVVARDLAELARARVRRHHTEDLVDRATFPGADESFDDCRVAHDRTLRSD
jgi:Tetratricopeptide repeat/Glycosyltransferase family 9 (heptosyltransferase)